MTKISLQNVSVYADEVAILRDVTTEFCSGELTVVLGPNGAGKTTLMRQAIGLISKYNGISTIDEVNSHKMTGVDRARKLAYLPQSRPLAWPLTVTDTVALGRFAYGATPGRLGSDDQAAVDRALQACNLVPLQNRRTDTLSGGELARVHFARAFAAEASLLLADEPVVSLDPRHQFLILQLIRRFVDSGGGAVVILHDPGIAARFADRLVWMQRGRIVADGTVEETLSEQRLADIYGVRGRIERHEDGLHLSLYGALD